MFTHCVNNILGQNLPMIKNWEYNPHPLTFKTLSLLVNRPGSNRWARRQNTIVSQWSKKEINDFIQRVEKHVCQQDEWKTKSGKFKGTWTVNCKKSLDRFLMFLCAIWPKCLISLLLPGRGKDCISKLVFHPIVPRSVANLISHWLIENLNQGNEDPWIHWVSSRRQQDYFHDGGGEIASYE